MVGVEPTTPGASIQCSTNLSYVTICSFSLSPTGLATTSWFNPKPINLHIHQSARGFQHRPKTRVVGRRATKVVNIRFALIFESIIEFLDNPTCLFLKIFPTILIIAGTTVTRTRNTCCLINQLASVFYNIDSLRMLYFYTISVCVGTTICVYPPFNSFFILEERQLKSSFFVHWHPTYGL